MTKKTFDLLLEKYLRGECSPKETQSIEDWLDLVGSDSSITKSDYEWESIKSEIWLAIETEVNKPNLKVSYSWKKYMQIAASIILISSITFWVLKGNKIFDNPNSVAAGLNTKTNQTKKYYKIVLSDGSTVSLAPNASISFPNNFSKNSREVFLDGKAFFEIEKNPKSPFLVHSNNIITKVLGTSFWVEPNSDKKSIEVKVVTGKVSVYEKQTEQKVQKIPNNNNGVIITPNQKVEFYESEKVFVTGIVDNPLIINTSEDQLPKSPNYIFQDTPISEVIALYEENYGINIEVETEHLKNCPITANLNGVSYYTALEIICKTINAKYETKGTSILIFGKGCN